MLVREKPVNGPVQSPSSSTVAVLIVDSHGGVSELIRHNIETATTRVFEAATGIDGIRVLAGNRIDLMLLDPSLPDVDIWTFLHHTRAVRPGRSLRVLFMSDDPPDRHLVRQFDVDGYVPKPFDIRDLMERIDDITRPGLAAKLPGAVAGN